MASDTFWTTQNPTLSPSGPVLSPTLRPEQADPLLLLQGLSPTGERNAALAAADAALFPRYDGVNVLVPQRPADFDAPTAASFARWHAFHQVEYLRSQGSVLPNPDGDATFSLRYASIGTNPLPFFNLHVVLSSDGRRPIVLNTLSATDIAALPLADQRAISAHPVFKAEFAEPLGLLPNTTVTTTTEARTLMRAIVQEQIDQIRSAPGFDPGRQADFDSNVTLRPQLYHYIFTGQLELLLERLDNMAIFNADMIRSEATAILDRFARLDRFMRLTPEGRDPGSNLPTGVNATDGGDSLRDAQKVLTGIELTLLDLARTARNVALSGRYEGRRVDTPDLVFLFQTFQNYANEAEAEGKSEELKQLQRLLQDYTAFQRLLNATLQVFDPVKLADPDTVERLGLKGQTTLNAEFDANERRLIAMFDSRLTTAVANNSWNPVETQRALERPTEALLSFGLLLNTYAKTVWDALARNIAEATKILNQDSQLRMDEISRLNREKNRNYDLATNTLNKMTDVLRSIIN